MPTINDIYIKAVEEFYVNDISSPEVNAEWILSYALNLKKSEYMLNKFDSISEKRAEAIDLLVKRHISGEPVQYITGSTEFYNTTILVGPRVLIPRPETERLVDIAINLIKTDHGPILDLCTGSGCIIFAMANELSSTRQFVGIDISRDAIQWATRNLMHHRTISKKYSTISFIQGNLFTPLRNDFRYEIITANPPYISVSEFENLPETVRGFEPCQALLSENNGLMILGNIVKNAFAHLVKDGWLVCEIGETQGGSALNFFENYRFKNIRIFKDYTGRDRIIIGQNKNVDD